MITVSRTILRDTPSVNSSSGRPTPARPPRSRWSIVAALLCLLGGAGAWLGLRSRPATSPVAPAGPIDATEARLRAAAAAAPTDPTPCRELGDHFARERRYFSALWEFQSALNRESGDAE